MTQISGIIDDVNVNKELQLLIVNNLDRKSKWLVFNRLLVMSMGAFLILNFSFVQFFSYGVVGFEAAIIQIGALIIGGLLIYYGQQIKKYLNDVIEISESEGQVLLQVYERLSRSEVYVEKTRMFISFFILGYGIYVFYYALFITPNLPLFLLP